jgi:hypothetical protein
MIVNISLLFRQIYVIWRCWKRERIGESFFFMSLSVCTSDSLSACVLLCLPVCLSVGPFVCLPISLSACLCRLFSSDSAESRSLCHVFMMGDAALVLDA